MPRQCPPAGCCSSFLEPHTDISDRHTHNILTTAVQDPALSRLLDPSSDLPAFSCILRLPLPKGSLPLAHKLALSPIFVGFFSFLLSSYNHGCSAL